MTKTVNAVGVIFENEEGKILVLKRHPDSPEGTAWGLVGGNIDPGEDAVMAAIREVQEEIGHAIDSKDMQFVKSYNGSEMACCCASQSMC